MVEISRRLSVRVSIALFALAALACGESETPQSPSASELENIDLNVRVHLLQSSELEPLNSTLSDSELDVLLVGVNEAWKQAGITWRLESVVREPAQNAEGYAEVLRGVAPATTELLSSIFPKENLLGGEWDVFIVKDLGDIAGGVYLQSLGVVIFAEFGVAGAQTPTGAGRRILAHELGHSLGLAHVPCTLEGNLMAPGCPSEDRTRLEAQQVQAARQQARRGRPFGL
ncbi:MAG: hypothetical protein HKM89_13440 [Gemmatimonadales bacterium]|nr:hypothetical protein [Gemmatimonadales bacterium]